MNRTLEARMNEVQALPEADQARLAGFIGEFIDDAQGAAQFVEDMKDPKYRAYVEAGVAQGEADIQAGRFAPAREVLPKIIADFKAQNGL